MKIKTFLVAAFLSLVAGVVRADETCTVLRSAEPGIALSYEHGEGLDPFFIGKDKFSTAIPGNKLVVNGTITGDGDHKFYLGDFDGNKLPGADYREIAGMPANNIFLTEDMLQKIVTEEKDLRIYGEGITVTSVELCTGKAGGLKSGRTIWTGFFWADEWSTLKLFKAAVTCLNLNEYAAIRVYYEANRTDFTMHLFKDAATDDNKIATNADESIRLNDHYADIPLTSSLITNIREASDELHFQFDKGSGDAFNVTDIVLIPKRLEGCDNCFYYTY